MIRTRHTLSALLLGSCLILAGCGDPKVDASTDEKMKESIAKVKAALPEAKRAEFEEALKTLAFADIKGLADLAKAGQTGGLERGIKDRLNGKTGAEIIAAAGQVQAERKERERKEATGEIDELRAKLAADKPDLLTKFVVERSRFGQSEGGFMRENIIELAVKNDSGKAVSRAFFHAVLLSPGREVPWVDDEFNYKIAGGLESGESAVWNLSPNMFGEWSNAPKDREDLILIVRAVGLEGSDGKPLGGERFTDKDAERLRSLVDSIQYDKGAEVKATLDGRAKADAEWRASAVAAAAKAEVEHLRKRKAESDQARASLAKFVVERSRFYFSEDRFSRDPVIDITVKNDTGQVVSRFYCRGVLSSPGRETPWVEDDFNYSVRGGLQPGESAQYKLSPNMFGEWGRAPRDRTDTVLTVTVKRVDGADEKELFPSDFSDADAKRLTALEKMIAENGWK